KCSYHQDRLWFIDQFESGNLYASSPVYHNIPVIAAIEGSLDIAKLESCLRKLVLENEILRMRIKDTDGVPSRYLSGLPDIRISVNKSLYGMSDSEWSSLSASGCALLISEAKEPFNLGEDSLLRVSVYACSEQRHLLSINIHHAIVDRVSCRLFLQSLFDAYTGNGLPEKKDSLPYAAFSRWQLDLSRDVLGYH
ncbi:condensation domain-containing protein, partial [Mucilaginibacter sp. RCC_168]|uniref:condensation domain-containing protein n=1 Tax=Mucilaginibacter sp. RCC_168 TaxID=3239221 RepID=UPI0035233481